MLAKKTAYLFDRNFSFISYINGQVPIDDISQLVVAQIVQQVDRIEHQNQNYKAGQDEEGEVEGEKERNPES